MSWRHTTVRKLSTQRVILRWKMKTVYQSFTTSKRFIQVSFYYQLLEVEFQHDVPLTTSLVYFLVYLTSLYFLLDEWNNFMERLGCKKESEVWENDENILQLRHWASLRGQTLCRTGTFKDFFLSHSFWLNSFLLIVYRYCIFFSVRGMMYYRRALKLQAFLDMASEGGKP